MGRGCPNNPRGHSWVGAPGEKRSCVACGTVDGGRRVTRPNPDDDVPPCTHHRQHKWLPDVYREVRVCHRCEMEAPLTGHAVARARRVRFLAERDGYQCFYCRLPFSDPMAGMATEDHRIPQARGGIRQMSNLVLACQRCNNWKADGTEFDLRRLPKFKDRLVMVERMRTQGRWSAIP